MNIHVEIAESESGTVIVRKPIKDITVMGFLCEFDLHESQSLVDEKGRYKSFIARIIPHEDTPEHHLPTPCNLHSVRRVSAGLSIVSFRYQSPIRTVKETLTKLTEAANLEQLSSDITIQCSQQHENSAAIANGELTPRSKRIVSRKTSSKVKNKSNSSSQARHSSLAKKAGMTVDQAGNRIGL